MILAIVFSGMLTWLTIYLSARVGLGKDESTGVQKFHTHSVARLGGIPIFVALCSALLLEAWLNAATADIVTRLIVCVLPAFLIGLVEDITRRAGITSRLVLTMVSAALAFWLLDGQLSRLDLPVVDAVLASSPLVCLLLTMFAAGGVAHSVNIIDGYNGLSGFFSVAAFISLGVIAHVAGDSLLASFCFISAAAVAGFVVWNFPFGRIFLGDSGAYMIGFLLAEFSVLLVHRNPAVSAWAPLLIMLYPIWETVFSMVRRASKGGLSQMVQPDALHLHQLVYRRLMKRFLGSANPRHTIYRNSFTSIYLWVLIVCSMLPAVLFSSSPPILMAFALLYVFTYNACYRGIVRFGVPRWLVARPAFLAVIAVATQVIPEFAEAPEAEE